MADQSPSKSDINAIFKRLRSVATNKVCFDCSAKNPTWASVTYGVFICIDCSAVHRSLGVHLSFVRSTQLDTNWTWLQLRAMQVGGNASAKSYFSQHNCTSTDAQQKYNSRAAHLYREKLHGMAVSAMRLHGNKLHIDTAHDGDHPVTTPEKKEVDFFSEHTEGSFYNNSNALMPEESADSLLNVGMPMKNGSLVEPTDGAGPRVDVALSSSPSEAAKMSDIRKPTIGQRRGVPAKKGLGAKKGGLGAQKVNANFSEIEKEAQLADQIREKTATDEKKTQEKNPEEEAQQMASIRLAYQDLSLQKKQAEDKLKQLDPKKATQMERLGMGFSGRSGQMTHSAASEMKTIEQENPNKPTSNYPRISNRDFFEDDFEIIGFSSGPPKYTDSPFSRDDKYSAYGSRNDEKFGEGVNKNSSWESEKKSSLDETMPVKESDDSHGRSRKAAVLSTPTSDEAVKKFGNAKSISSEQFFGNSSNTDFERRANLNRFEGSSSISSADYFGESSRSKPSATSSFTSPDLEDIREGVRAGVTKVAGKLSSLANGVMNSLQDRYGY